MYQSMLSLLLNGLIIKKTSDAKNAIAKLLICNTENNDNYTFR